MWTRIPSAAATLALAAASLAVTPGIAKGQQDSAQQADVQAWVGQWMYRIVLGSGGPGADMSGRITLELDQGKLTGDMNEERGGRRWRIEGVRVEHNRLTGHATLRVGTMVPEGAPGNIEDYRVLELQFKLEGGDRFTGSLRARSLRGSVEGRRP